MKHMQFVMGAALSLALPTIAAAQGSDSPLLGGNGGGEFRTACDPGDAIVGFDVGVTNVITRIAPVCGVKFGNGTKGRPFVGGGNNAGEVLHKPRCKPGSILTVIQVFIDKTPLVSAIGFACFDRNLNGGTNTPMVDGETNQPIPPIGNVAASVNNKNMTCDKPQTFGTAIFGRAGTAIDALGLHCDTVDNK